jgi:hypothetical protein
MPPAPQLTVEDIDRISSQVADKLEARMQAQWEARWEARFRAASVRNSIFQYVLIVNPKRNHNYLKYFLTTSQGGLGSQPGGSGSHQASPPAPQDDEDDDEVQWSDIGGDGTT